MNKKILLGLTAIVIGLVAIGCSGGATANSQEEVKGAAGGKLGTEDVGAKPGTTPVTE
jgi:hypothetical protein